MVTILCGRVAAGKTTLAKQICAQTGAIHLSCDDLMLTIFDGCLGQAHDQTAMKCLYYLFGLAVQLDTRGLDAVIDYGFWLRAERDAARHYFAARGIAHRMIVVQTQETVRRIRLAHRNDDLRQAQERVYLIEGEKLVRMDAKFEPLDVQEAVEYYDNTPERKNIE